MKNVKMLGLLAVAAAALMAFVGTASASTLTSSGATYTSTIEATSGTTEIHGAFSTIACKHSGFKGKVTAHGSAVTAGVPIESLSFGGECNQNFTPVVKGGTLEFHATGGHNGTVTSTGAELVVHHNVVGTCIFTTNNTPIGTFTGNTSGHAILDIGGAKIPRTGGNFFCGPTGEWTATYTFTNPTSLSVH